MRERWLHGGAYVWIAVELAMWTCWSFPGEGAETSGAHIEERPAIPRARVSLMVEDADIVDVLRLLAKQNDLNLHIHQDVKGKVTVRFNDVLLQEVLDSILRANGLDYVAYRDVILVKPASQSVAGELQTKVYALKYLDAHAMSQSLTSVLTPKGKATVVPVSMEKEATKDEQAASGLLVVTDTPAALGEVDALVEKLDAPMAQIMIEVQLIETTLSDEEKLGINWSISASISDETAVYDLHHLNAEGFRFGKLSLTELGVAMDALRTRGNTKLISNPKITTIENQTAEISVGTTVPIPQREIDERGRERITIEERDVSVRLSVTPRLNESDVITMTVRPQVEEITRWTEIESFPYPITSKRSVTTHVRVKDGEGIAIGGLVKENTIKTKNKLRILGDIPLLGYLFQHGETTKEKTDLLIFITPHVVK